MPYNTARKYYEGIQTRKDIYLYIIKYLKEHNYPPSIPERDWAPSFYDPDSGGKSNSHSL